MDRYPWELPERLGLRIELGERAQAHQAMRRLLRLMTEQGPTRFEVRKYRCAVALSRCTNGARRGGAASDALLELFWKRFEELTQLRSWKSVQRHMHRFVDELLDQVRPEGRSKIEEIVAWIREDLEDTLDSPKTLTEYADEVGVSRTYLSRFFPVIVGRTFREEQQRVRTEMACELLRQTALKVGVIARRLGMRDPSQFIAVFRRATGLTPAAYRRRHLETG
jgi:AraC-like DNA-binding protein